MDKLTVSCAEALLHQGAVAADKVNTHGLRRFVKSMSIFDRITAAGCHQHCDRGNADSFIYNGDTVLLFDGFTHCHQILCPCGYFFIDFAAGAVYVAVCTVQQGNSHGYCSYIKVFILDHGYGFQYVVKIKHFCPPKD